MRSLILFTLILTFCGIGIHVVHPHDTHSDLYSESPWRAQLQEFQKLLKTDADAAHSELQNVSKKLFGEHVLTQEWIPLYLRISKGETAYPSDLKRVSELEIRMLKSMDPEKYAKQIQHHQKAIEHYAELNDRVTPLEGRATNLQGGVSGAFMSDPSEDNLHYFRSFFQLLPKDPKAARAALDKFAALEYQDHPLKEAWTELYFRHHQAKKAKILESIRVKELQKQMLTDLDAEKHAKVIKDLEGLIKYQNRLQRTFERQGKPTPTIDIEVKFNTKKED